MVAAAVGWRLHEDETLCRRSPRSHRRTQLCGTHDIRAERPADGAWQHADQLGLEGRYSAVSMLFLVRT